ncbi:MAG: hypothetical protein A3K77_06395 [Euryarchaeota archaeon RBG_13_31_8]|nr:MAG: hypothetical protein A3K77_06395 [Euryarchaeota archaeon RBG_13_31_8]
MIEKLYGLFTKNISDIDFLADDIKVALCTSGYSPNQDTHEFLSDITNEVSGVGYTAGGKLLENKTETYTALTNTTKWDADDTQWAASTITARYAILYKSTGNAATSPLIAYYDFETDQSGVLVTFKITWPTEGLINLVVG